MGNVPRGLKTFKGSKILIQKLLVKFANNYSKQDIKCNVKLNVFKTYSNIF